MNEHLYSYSVTHIIIVFTSEINIFNKKGIKTLYMTF